MKKFALSMVVVKALMFRFCNSIGQDLKSRPLI